MPIENIKTEAEIITEHMVSSIAKVKADPKSHIYSAISAESQQNASLGLIPQEQSDCIKAQITLAMTENDTFKSELSVLTTNAEIDAYMANIVRTALDECRPVGV